jgi:predicted nucleotidyltransferase
LRTIVPQPKNYINILNAPNGFGGGGSEDPPRTTETIIEAVKKYAAKVRSSFPVVKTYLFGSWAKGTANFNSDADVCFFLESWGGRERIDVLVEMSLMSLEFGWAFIETHAFLASAMEINSSIIEEIIKTGIEI